MNPKAEIVSMSCYVLRALQSYIPTFIISEPLSILPYERLSNALKGVFDEF